MANARSLALFGGTPVIPGDSHRIWPDIREEDYVAVRRVLDRGILAGPQAPEVTAFEDEYARYCGAKYAVATNSGTAALHCAAAAVGVKPGDEVIAPAYTFVATAEAMMHQGARVVFADVDPRTYNLDATKLAERITDRTRAVVAVAIHGQPADLDEIAAIIDPAHIALIQDNAQAHGILYKGRKTGSIGAVSATSTNASKNLSAGEGGVFTTNNESAYTIARRLTVFGEDPAPLLARAFWAHGIGWNYRSQELVCALARAQLTRLDGYNSRAQSCADRLTMGLSKLKGLIPPLQASDRGCSWWKYAIQLDTNALGFTGDPRDLRDLFVQALLAEGVHAMVWQGHPVPAQPAFRRPAQTWSPRTDLEPLLAWDPSDFPIATHLCNVTFSLGTESYPLYVQEPALMDAYVQACEKVLGNLELLLTHPFTPTRRMT